MQLDNCKVCLISTMGIGIDYHYFQEDKQMEFTEKALTKQGYKVIREYAKSR